MRALAWILVIAAIGFIAYTKLHKPLSEEEEEVKQLEDRFHRATRQFLGAGRIAGEIGLDTTSDSYDAIIIIKQVKKELMNLKTRLSEEAAVERAKKLEAKLKEFYTKNDLES